MIILKSVQGRGLPVIEAQYKATGRLTSLNYSITKLFRFFISILSNPNYEENGKENGKDNGKDNR